MADLHALFEQIQGLTWVEATELLHLMEKNLRCRVVEWPPGVIIVDPAPPTPEPDPAEFSVILLEGGLNAVQVVRRFTTFGVLDAKKLVDSAPVVVKEGLTKAEAERLRNAFLDAGASAEIRHVPIQSATAP